LPVGRLRDSDGSLIARTHFPGQLTNLAPSGKIHFGARFISIGPAPIVHAKPSLRDVLHTSVLQARLCLGAAFFFTDFCFAALFLHALSSARLLLLTFGFVAAWRNSLLFVPLDRLLP